MIRFYLLVNSVLYVLLSAWCLMEPLETANYLGLSFLNASGEVEYLTSYVGLEMGFALFLTLAIFYPNIRIQGLIFCVCIYASSILVRTGSAFSYEIISKPTYMVGALEYILGAWGVILLILEQKKLK